MLREGLCEVENEIVNMELGDGFAYDGGMWRK